MGKPIEEVTSYRDCWAKLDPLEESRLIFDKAKGDANLPEDLIEEIISCVPANFLKQLRSTCKWWNSLFNNRRFAGKHLSKAPKQYLILMLKECRVCPIRIRADGIPQVAGELSLVDPLSSLAAQLEISKVCHCDGLLLCTDEFSTKIVIWNPCTGQTRWIQPGGFHYYNFGSYQDNLNQASYKILGYSEKEFGIYEINSNSWRPLAVTLDCCDIGYTDYGVSLQGSTYWFGVDDDIDKQLGVFLLSFDYQTERFARLPLPYQWPRYQTASLTTVRNEKLSVLLQREETSKIEIWVSSVVGETKVVSWSLLLTVDFPPQPSIWDGVTFVVDEEQKVVFFCDKYFGKDEFDGKILVHVVGEHNQVREVEFGAVVSWPSLFHYVPSLIQIQQGGIRKRD